MPLLFFYFSINYVVQAGWQVPPSLFPSARIIQVMSDNSQPTHQDSFFTFTFTSIMPSNTQSERNDAAGSSSKTSLLWAYQLRREHVHLVDRIDDMGTQLVSCNNKSQTYEQNLYNLESLVKTLQAENYTLKNEVTLVRTKLTARIEDINQQITSFAGGDSALKDVTTQLEVELRTMGVQVAELSKSVSELKGETTTITNQKEDHGTRPVEIESTQDNTDLAKIESGSEQIETRPKCVVRLSLGKKKGRSYCVCNGIYLQIR